MFINLKKILAISFFLIPFVHSADDGDKGIKRLRGGQNTNHPTALTSHISQEKNEENLLKLKTLMNDVQKNGDQLYIGEILNGFSVMLLNGVCDETRDLLWSKYADTMYPIVFTYLDSFFENTWAKFLKNSNFLDEAFNITPSFTDRLTDARYAYSFFKLAFFRRLYFTRMMFDGNNNIPTYLHRLLGATMTFLRKRGAIGITSETKQFQPYVEFDQYNCFELIKLLPIQLPNGEEGIFYKKDTQGRQIRFSNIKGEKYQEVDGQDFRQATSNTYGFDLIEGVYPFFTLKKLDTSDTKTAMHHMVNYDEELAFQRGLAYEKSSHLIQQVLDNNDIGNYLIKIMDSDTLKCFSATSKQYYDRTNAVQKDRKPVILRTRFDECFLNLMKNGNFAKSIESLDGFIFKPGCKEDLIHTWPFKVLSFMDNIETIKIHDIDVCDEDLADLEKEAELYKESKAPSSLRAISIYAVNLPIGRYEGSIEKALTMLTSNTPSLEKIVTLASFSSYKPGHKACLKTVILKKDNKETTMSADNVFWPTALTHFFKVLTNSKKNFKIELPDFYLTGEAERQLDPTGTPMEFACVPNDLDFNKGLYDTWLPTIKEGLKSNFDLDIEIVNIKGENLPTAVFTKIHTEGSKATA